MTAAKVQELPKKQQHILTTAEELFFRYGIKRVTVEEICQKAGVSKMTFYKYFSDKIALAKYIWQIRVVDESLAKLDELDALNIPFREKIERIFEFAEQLVAKMENEYIKDFIALDFDRLNLDQIMQRFKQIFTDAQQRGEVRPNIRPEFLLAMHEKTHELMRDEKLLELYPDYSAYNRECFDFLCYGMLTTPSR
ncbi:MAG: TetR/AcrR family transcriptional regulator [Candidatus Vecturithrix sp.]|jgi:AcrR family transcriptional regulator|nr:TetR/AcrR family transcriptional regulator [Candidatus Vecturithrix sp.]